MKPIYLTVGHQPLLIVPETQAHLNGHTIITRTYFLYKQSGLLINHELIGQEEKLGVPDFGDPDYYGYLEFDIPGKLFTYYPEGLAKMDQFDLNELVEHLSGFRDDPGRWPVL